jgi:hypothetical protein
MNSLNTLLMRKLPKHGSNKATHVIQNRRLCVSYPSFGDHIISKGLWPPHLPDLSPPYYFLWDYIQDSAYCNNPHNLDELRTSIFNITANISLMVLQVCLRTSFIMLERGCNMLVYTFKSFCKQLTLNKHLV